MPIHHARLPHGAMVMGVFAPVDPSRDASGSLGEPRTTDIAKDVRACDPYQSTKRQVVSLVSISNCSFCTLCRGASEDFSAFRCIARASYISVVVS